MDTMKMTVDRRLKVSGKIIGKYAKGRLLDLGCNKNALKKYLPKEIEYVGKDYPEVDLEKSRLPFRNNSFDCVSMLEVMEHLKEPTHIIKEIKRVAKPNGIIFISLPNSNHIYYRLKFLFGKPNDELPFGHQTKKHLHFPIRSQSITFIKKYFRIVKIIDIGLPAVLDRAMPNLFSYATLFILKQKRK